MFKAKPNDPASANEVIAEAEAALRADPSFARAYQPMAVGESLLGHYEQSMSDLEQAMRISPRDSSIGLWHMEMGRELLALRRYDAAIQEGLKAIDSGYRTVLSYAALAAFYAAADKMPEAKAALAEAMKFKSQTLRGVVSRAHTFLYRLAAGFPRSADQGRVAGGVSADGALRRSSPPMPPRRVKKSCAIRNFML